MNKCPKCLHYSVCEFKEKDFNECSHFKDKSLFIKLPCKVGTPVFIINKTMGYIHTGKFRLDDIDQFGKRVFLSKAKAEKALKVG